MNFAPSNHFVSLCVFDILCLESFTNESASIDIDHMLRQTFLQTRFPGHLQELCIKLYACHSHHTF